MKYFIIKLKDHDLFFNTDEGIGEYICDTPMLMDKQQVDAVMKYSDIFYDIDGVTTYNKDQVEVREASLQIL